VVVAVLEVASGAAAVVLSLVVVAPLIAASSLSARATGAYAVLATLTGAALGVPAEQYEQGQVANQAIRLCTIVAAGALAVVGADLRTRRETRLAQVLRVAAAAQQAVLPPLPERLGTLALAASYDSAAAEAAVGGDTYAAELTTEHGVRLLIADVRGHGLEAVRLAVTVLGAFRERAHEAPDAVSLVASLDRAVGRAASDEDFVTALVAQVQDGVLSLANAGHAPPLLLRGGSVTALSADTEAPPLGLGTRPDLCTVALRPLDRLVLYTDGAAEARRPSDGAFFDVEQAAATHLADGELAAGLAALRASLLSWTGQALHDDVTVLVAELRA
jgi:serine phosphatase RsbU (regulator of sigma subunit)